jgi:hypothetical protein
MLARFERGKMKSAMERTNWSVVWLNPRGKWIEKRPGPQYPGLNFVDALELYEKVKSAGRRGVALRCKNVGFPPPERLMPRKVRVKTKKRGRTIIREGIYTPMRKYNDKGIWWCPYCMRLRRFKPIRNRYNKTVTYRCPSCGVEHRGHHVRAHNPVARLLP